MKTQLITLISHDDLISVRDRMSWAKTPRILLVWPGYEKISLRQVDLKVLQRHAASLGAELGLVTRVRRARQDAEALRIPVFESTGQAQRVAWPRPRPRRWQPRPPRRDLREQRDLLPRKPEGWQAHPATRGTAFLTGVLSVLVLVALFIPRADVILRPESRIQSLVIPVIAGASVEEVFITGTIPAREMRAIVAGTHSVTVTGQGIIPQSRARGMVIFQNLTQQAISIPAGTVVRTADELRFETTRSGEIAAGLNETLELPVRAIESGRAGNAEAETLVIVEGRLGLSVSVTNPEPLSGGREIPSVQASDADRERARRVLLARLEEEARREFASKLQAGDVLFGDTLVLAQIHSEVYDPPPGAASTKLTVSMQAEFQAHYASAMDLTQLAGMALNASVPAGFLPASGAPVLEAVTQPAARDDGFIRWTMRAERRIVQAIDTARVTQEIQGLGKQRARSFLAESFPLEDVPEIRLSPAWWPWIPIAPFRISVVAQ